MENGVSGDDLENIDWDTDDEFEIFGVQNSLQSSFPATDSRPIPCNGEANSSAGSSNGNLINHFMDMGFPKDLVKKVMEEAGDNSAESSILEALLTYSALAKSPEELGALESSSEELQGLDKSPEEQWGGDNNLSSSDYDDSYSLCDSDGWSDNEQEGNPECISEENRTLHSLVKMGYSLAEASKAMERCPEASVVELADCIYAHQLAIEQDRYLPDDSKPWVKPMGSDAGKLKKRRLFANMYNRKKLRGMLDEEMIRLPHPMIGFGLPTAPNCMTCRTLPEQTVGPPYFYYENVALTPKGVWDTISRFLYGVEPEFVDSKYFCAAARKRGYIHNLPIDNRFPLVPAPPFTIHDAFPLTRRWWPSWDTRTKLNCLQTAIGSAKLQERIRKAIEDYDDVPPPHVQKYVLDQCRKWNLVWVGRNKVAPLEPDEVEMLLGFPKNHTRGGGTSRTERYKSLGNSFQVDTVAYHLSVLKQLFPKGINVLSLFSGIGGAEVALHRLGIPLNNVVSVEKSEVNRNIVRCWWEQTNQKGNLIDFEDVQRVDTTMLEKLIDNIGGFDLVVGGSPCNNLAGSNRVSRDGLEGKESSLFYDYFRILDDVKTIMAGKNELTR